MFYCTLMSDARTDFLTIFQCLDRTYIIFQIRPITLNEDASRTCNRLLQRFTNHVSGKGNAIGHVRPFSVH